MQSAVSVAAVGSPSSARLAAPRFQVKVSVRRDAMPGSRSASVLDAVRQPGSGAGGQSAVTPTSTGTIVVPGAPSSSRTVSRTA